MNSFIQHAITKEMNEILKDYIDSGYIEDLIERLGTLAAQLRDMEKNGAT